MTSSGVEELYLENLDVGREHGEEIADGRRALANDPDGIRDELFDRANAAQVVVVHALGAQQQQIILEAMPKQRSVLLPPNKKKVRNFKARP